MTDSAVVYKAEGFWSDRIEIQVGLGDVSKLGFELIYLLTNQEGKEVARVKTGLVCFDYENRKVALLPEVAKEKVLSRVIVSGD